MFTSRDARGHRSETVRRANLSAIVTELHLRGPLSRSELGARTGLTRSAIRALIGELVVAGLVEEVRNTPQGAPGRPSPIVQPRPDAALALALEVNVDSLAAARVSFGGNVERLVRVDRPRAHLAESEIIDDLVELAAPFLDPVRDDAALLGVGVAVAGVVRRTDGMVRHAPNFGWRDVALRRHIEASLRLDVPVTVANEADLGALAEHRRGAAVGADAVLYVMGEVGVGGNVLVDGQPLRGAAGYAGEVGHMPVNPDGARCGCGSRGCWETEIGERALLSRAGRPADGGREAVADVVAAAEAGEPAALTAIGHVATWLGIGLAGLVNVFNPSLIVLGGLFQRIHPLIHVEVDRVLGERALVASRELVRIVPATLGADAPVIGAAEAAFEPLLADPAARLATLSRRPSMAVGYR